jgi:hypothetical protein
MILSESLDWTKPLKRLKDSLAGVGNCRSLNQFDHRHITILGIFVQIAKNKAAQLIKQAVSTVLS